MTIFMYVVTFDLVQITPQYSLEFSPSYLQIFIINSTILKEVAAVRGEIKAVVDLEAVT